MEPTSHYVQAGGLDLHYVDWGGEGRQPMLLLHGLQDCARLWDFFAETVRERYHVIALDHRGHGDSPPTSTDRYRLSDYVDEARDVITQLGLRDVILAGHSAGSKNAWMLAAEHPELVAKLIITDMDPDRHNPGSVDMITRYKSESDDYPDLGAVIERIRSRQPESSDDVLRHTAEQLTRPNEAGGLTWKRHRDVVLHYDRPDVWATLPEVRVPTLIVRGGDSTLLNGPVAHRMQKEIPDCKLVEIPNAAHWVHLEQPDAYTATVADFLG